MRSMMRSGGRSTGESRSRFARSDVNITSAAFTPVALASACSMSHPQDGHHIPDTRYRFAHLRHRRRICGLPAPSPALERMSPRA